MLLVVSRNVAADCLQLHPFSVVYVYVACVCHQCPYFQLYQANAGLSDFFLKKEINLSNIFVLSPYWQIPSLITFAPALKVGGHQPGA